MPRLLKFMLSLLEVVSPQQDFALNRCFRLVEIGGNPLLVEHQNIYKAELYVFGTACHNENLAFDISLSTPEQRAGN